MGTEHTMEVVLAWHTAGLGSIPGTPYGTLTPLGLIQGHSRPRAPPGMAQKQDQERMWALACPGSSPSPSPSVAGRLTPFLSKRESLSEGNGHRAPGPSRRPFMPISDAPRRGPLTAQPCLLAGRQPEAVGLRPSRVHLLSVALLNPAVAILSQTCFTVTQGWSAPWGRGPHPLPSLVFPGPPPDSHMCSGPPHLPAEGSEPGDGAG